MAKKRSYLEYIIGAKNQTTKTFKRIGVGIKGITDRIFSIKTAIAGMLAGAGFKALGSSAIETASDFESLETALTTVLGSQQKAAEAMRYANEQAAASPYTVKEYAEAIQQLAAYGIDYKSVMTALGDTSASMNKPLMQAVEALSDAVQGEGERLKEFGIKQSVAGNQITYTWVDTMGNVRTTIAENNPKIIEETLKGIWNEKYAGGMQKFGSTWKGLTSTAMSLWEEFTLKVMNSGPFQVLKVYVDELIKKVNDLKASGDFSRMAKEIGVDVANGIIYVISLIPRAVKGILNAAELVVVSMSGWKLLFKQLEIAWLTIELKMLQGLKTLREMFGDLAMGVINLISLLPGMATAVAAARPQLEKFLSRSTPEELNREAVYMANLESKKQQAIDDSTAMISGLDATKKKFDEYAQKADAVASVFDEIEKKARGVVDSGMSGEMSTTTTAVIQTNDQLDIMLARIKEVKAEAKALGVVLTTAQRIDGMNSVSLDKRERTE